MIRRSVGMAVRKVRWSLALVATLLTVACGGVEAAADPSAVLGQTDVVDALPEAELPQPEAGPEAPAASVAFSLEPDAAPATSVDLFSTPELFVVADWTGVDTSLSQRIELFAPNGGLYFSTVIPFAGTERGDASVSVEPDGSYRVWFVLQIAGTPIEMFAMSGTWRAAVSLVGGETSASATVALQ
jgi:hypothetical protein